MAGKDGVPKSTFDSSRLARSVSTPEATSPRPNGDGRHRRAGRGTGAGCRAAEAAVITRARCCQVSTMPWNKRLRERFRHGRPHAAPSSGQQDARNHPFTCSYSYSPVAHVSCATLIPPATNRLHSVIFCSRKAIKPAGERCAEERRHRPFWIKGGLGPAPGAMPSEKNQAVVGGEPTGLARPRRGNVRRTVSSRINGYGESRIRSKIAHPVTLYG